MSLRRNDECGPTCDRLDPRTSALRGQYSEADMELESVPDVSSVLASHSYSFDGLLYQYDRNGYQALGWRTIAGINGHHRV